MPPLSAHEPPGLDPGQRWVAPELLAPAGDWECVRAAVENGADAIYFGLERFNARIRAHNFTAADLPDLMAFLHRRGVRGYLSFNTLVFTDELAEAETYLRTCIAAGVDAAIVQDIGICRLIRQLSPDFPIHASTQMTVTSAAGVAFARELGCSLVVLARECSLREIERLQADLRTAAGPGAPGGFPLEVFVHGALCVAYSGQCLTSEALGGRSANRGECAQACRLPYDLVADGQVVPLGDRRYLLSPQDLAGLEVLPELVRLGIRSLKIEGRLKSPEYVANITRIYRQAIDTVMAQAQASAADPRLGSALTTPPPRLDSRPFQYDLEMAFSRGLYTGWFRGVNHQQLVHGRFGKKRGVYLGRVKRVDRSHVTLELEAPLKPGDGVVFDAGTPDQPEQGGRVYTLSPRGRDTGLSFGRGDVDFQRVHPGDRVWKTSDPELDRRLRQTFETDQPRFRRPLTMQVHGRAGQPLRLTVTDEAGRVVQIDSAATLASAEQRPLTEARLIEQLGRLGGTPFQLREFHAHLEGAVHLAVSELNRMRREAITRLETLRTQPQRWQLLPRPAPETGPAAPGRAPDAAPRSPGVSTDASTLGPPAAPKLAVLVRSLPQLDAARAAGVTTLYCELEDPKKYREAVERCRIPVRDAPASSPTDSPVTLFVVPPRIAKPGEDWILKQVRSSDADGYLVRNYDQLEYFRDARCVGDFALNIANPLAAAWLRERYRLERLTASYDLNNLQLEALLQAAPPGWLEITIHQHMPMFHMEHCLFCAFLSSGTDYTNCGRPCDRHELRLRDRVGAEHPVKADAGCRNTVYNALAQTGAEYVDRLLALGAQHFRLEFLTESPDTVARTIEMYQRLLRGQIRGGQLWRELKLRHQLGVTRGSLDKAERPITVL